MIKIRDFTPEEEFSLCRDLDGIYLVEMVNILKKIKSTLETCSDISEELKTKLTDLSIKIENETIGLDDAIASYENLEEEIERYYYQKQRELELSKLSELSSTLTARLKDSLNICIDSNNFKKAQRLCEQHIKVLHLISLAINGYAETAVVMNLEKLTYDNEINDRLVMQATFRNEVFIISPIYLKINPNELDECNFAVLVKEDEEYFMVSYNIDGSILFKEQVKLVASSQDYIDGSMETVASRIFTIDGKSEYVPINEVFNSKDKWRYKLSLNYYATKVFNETTKETRVVIGNYYNYELCLKDGIIYFKKPNWADIEKQINIKSAEFAQYLDGNSLIKIIEEQVASILNQGQVKKR